MTGSASTKSTRAAAKSAAALHGPYQSAPQVAALGWADAALPSGSPSLPCVVKNMHPTGSRAYPVRGRGRRLPRRLGQVVVRGGEDVAAGAADDRAEHTHADHRQPLA